MAKSIAMKNWLVTILIAGSLASFPLLDNRGILHEYRKEYNRITHPTHKDKFQVYCGIHFQWETIRIAWGRGSLNKIEQKRLIWRWTYMVDKSKKQ